MRQTLKLASIERIEKCIDKLIAIFTQLKQSNELDLVILARASCCLPENPRYKSGQWLMPDVALFDRNHLVI